MKKKIELGEHQIECVFKKNKLSKGIKITLKNSHDFLVTYPWFISQKKAEKFFIKNKDWVLKNLEVLKSNDFSNLLGWGGRRDYLKNKERARDLVRERVAEINQTYNLTINKIAIRDQKTRWGSCSSKNNLNFNYRILFLPDDLVDYLIVHELCHLREMNHSRKFWELVALRIPNYRQKSKKLKNL
ncbi:MAG: M48 family metallopeptidase [Candidatus Moranbacteria bacterium]|nr:M48 family metallopeptidase [Candidatus Moranbacteria bacterium]